MAEEEIKFQNLQRDLNLNEVYKDFWDEIQNEIRDIGYTSVDELVSAWATGAYQRKGHAAKQLERKGGGKKWKKEVLSPKAVKERKERLIAAIEAGLIEKGLQDVDEAEWENLTKSGLQKAGREDYIKGAKKFAKKALSYVAIVHAAKRRLEELGITGLDAARWWNNLVNKVLELVKLGKISPSRAYEIVTTADDRYIREEYALV